MLQVKIAFIKHETLLSHKVAANTTGSKHVLVCLHVSRLPFCPCPSGMLIELNSLI